MSNTYRGETPFRALGREMFLVYRTQEIAAMQTALGFVRPEALAPATTEAVPALNLRRLENRQIVHAADSDGRALAKLKDDGSPEMRTVIVNQAERHRRLIESFDAVLLSPLAADLLVMIRCGLAPWERDNGKLEEPAFEKLVEELGLAGLNMLHQRTLANSYASMLPADAERSDDPNATSPESAFQT